MASGPVTSWKIEGVKVEAVTDFIFLDSKISDDIKYSDEIKRHLFHEDVGSDVMICFFCLFVCFFYVQFQARFFTLLFHHHQEVI